MRRSTYDNSYNRNRVRIDGRDSGNWASRIGVRSQHKDMRGRVIGGIASDGTAFGTKERQPARQLGATEAPAPIAKPAPAAAPRPVAAQPKPAPRPTGIQASIPKANPLGAKLFPDRSKPTPENKLTPQIATSTPGARTSNINRLTGKPMGWRPGDDAPDAAVAAKPAAPKLDGYTGAAPTKQAPAWTSKASPVAPSPTKMAPPADRMPTPTSSKPTPPAPATAPAPITVAGTPIRTENYGKGAQSPASTPIAAKPAPAPQPATEAPAPQPDKVKRANFTASMRWQDKASTPSASPAPAPAPAEITGSAMAMDRMRRPKNPLKTAETRASMRWQDRAM